MPKTRRAITSEVRQAPKPATVTLPRDLYEAMLTMVGGEAGLRMILASMRRGPAKL